MLRVVSELNERRPQRPVQDFPRRKRPSKTIGNEPAHPSCWRAHLGEGLPDKSSDRYRSLFEASRGGCRLLVLIEASNLHSYSGVAQKVRRDLPVGFMHNVREPQAEQVSASGFLSALDRSRSAGSWTH